MATKRILYKPAEAKIGKRRNRRPLTQGRLVTAPPQSVPSGPRLLQGQANDGQTSILSTHTLTEDPNATPRRSVPRASEHQSPVRSPPAPTLDLSDDGDDLDVVLAKSKAKSGRAVPQSVSGQVPVHHHAHVMVLDASAITHSPDGADVDCVVGYERSPATIICHSPATNSTSPRREDNVWHVQVDQVPRVSAVSSGVISPLAAAATNRGDRETAEVASTLDTDGDEDTLISRASRQEVTGSARMASSAPKLPQPNFDESGESEKTNSKRGATKKKQAAPPALAEATSDSDVCSLFEYVPQIKNRPPKTSGSAHQSSRAPKSEKKKKGERTVSSRYMQSAMSKKPSSSSLAEKSSLTKRSLNLGSSSGSNSGLAGGSAVRKTPSRSRSARKYPAGSSPDCGKASIPQGKTSTPTHDSVPVMASCDASAINPELSMLSAIDASHMRIRGSSGHSDGHGSPTKQTKKLDPRIQQQRLDLTYARYLQWLFLDTKATKMLHQQEKNAMRQLHALWEMMESKRHEKAELEQDLERLRHLNMLDEQLETQQRGLEPMARVLPMLQKDYSGLAAALDTTRHQIQTHGVHIPEDEDFYLASLEQVLQESEQLLGNLSMMTKVQAPAVNQFADAIKAVEKAVEAECLELYRCGELLSAVQSLSTHENSLRIQAMQAHR